MDRIDVQKEVHPVGYFELESLSVSRDSKTLRIMVKEARKIQQERFANEEGVNSNAQMTTSMIQKFCGMDKDSLALLKENCEKYGYYRDILRLYSLGYSRREIAFSVHSSRNKVSEVIDLSEAIQVSWPFDPNISNTDLEMLLYLKRVEKNSERMPIDFPKIHRELANLIFCLFFAADPSITWMTGFQICDKIKVLLFQSSVQKVCNVYEECRSIL